MAYKILLDAGHYGHTNGSPCVTKIKYYESDMSWTLHNYLKAELQKYGFVVAVTRADKNKDLQVYDRGQMAKGYDMILSLHSNASPFNDVYEGLDRPVVIYPLKGDSKVKAFATTLASTVYDVMKTKQKYQVLTREYPGYPGYDYYGVIRGAVDAGCKNIFIIEHGFHTDTDCTNWLLKTPNLQALAVAEAKAVANFFGVTMPTTTVNPSTSTTTNNVVYRVQVGSYTKKENAEALLAKLKAAGFNAYIKAEKT